MTGVTLRHRWDCEASHAVRIALALKEIDHDLDEAPPLMRESVTDQAAAVDATPTLWIDGCELTHAMAILEYLEETRSDPAILPGAASERARVRALVHTVATQFAPVADPRVADHVAWLNASGEAGRLNWRRRFIARGLASVEKLLDSPLTGRFCDGDEPTMADCVLIPHVVIARRWGAPLLPFPRVTAIDLRCASHPAFMAAHPDLARQTAEIRRRTGAPAVAAPPEVD